MRWSRTTLNSYNRFRKIIAMDRNYTTWYRKRNNSGGVLSFVNSRVREQAATMKKALYQIQEIEKN
jgi:hypothetical protein